MPQAAERRFCLHILTTKGLAVCVITQAASPFILDQWVCPPGRMDSYHAAEAMGIHMKKEWLATLDNRTRHAHAVLDGQKADVGEPFRVDGQEYRGILGNKVPNTLDSFQNLKYNNHEIWKQLQTAKRQTVFVNNAPCETTKKKYSGYFLKEGAKHADQFFDVGYTANDVLQLRYDMAKQFDMSKAVEFRDRNGGARTFNIYMELGVTKKRSFATSWMEDFPGSTPRIITAFRKNKEDSNDK